MSPDCAPGSQLKRGFDLLVASALLILLSPLFAVIALLIRCTSGSPVDFPSATARIAWRNLHDVQVSNDAPTVTW